jgi:hypothetical protein
MRQLRREIAVLHPTLADRLEVAATRPVRSTWFWNLAKELAGDPTQHHFDRVLGLYYHAKELWFTNGQSIYRVGIDGQRKEVVELTAPARRSAERRVPTLRSVAVSERFLVVTMAAGVGETYHVQQRGSARWKEVVSPFRSGQSAEHDAFSDLTFVNGRVFRPVQIRSSENARLFAIEMLDPDSGTLSYPVRGDRSPPEGPMDVAGNRFEIGGVDATGALLILSQKTGGNEKAEAHAWHPQTRVWRRLSTEEARAHSDDRLQLSTLGRAANAASEAQQRSVRTQSRASEAAPPRLVALDDSETRMVPLELVISTEDEASLRTHHATAHPRNNKDVISDMIAGRQVRAHWIPEGVVVISWPAPGIFFFDHAAIAGWVRANQDAVTAGVAPPQ